MYYCNVYYVLKHLKDYDIQQYIKIYAKGKPICVSDQKVHEKYTIGYANLCNRK